MIQLRLSVSAWKLGAREICAEQYGQPELENPVFTDSYEHFFGYSEVFKLTVNLNVLYAKAEIYF